MLTNKQFCENALTLLGQPYSVIDCIGVVRRAAGIACQGTNWLWRSYKNAAKYKYLKDRKLGQVDSESYIDGLLVFKIKEDQIPDGYDDKPNCYHVGVLYEGNVIQSNPSTGVYMSPFRPEEWQGYGKLKQVEYTEKTESKQQLTDHEMLVKIYNKLFSD